MRFQLLLFASALYTHVFLLCIHIYCRVWTSLSLDIIILPDLILYVVWDIDRLKCCYHQQKWKYETVSSNAVCLGHLGRTKTKKITFGNHTKFVLGLAALSVVGNIQICINPGGGEGRVEEARDVSNFKTPCGPEVSRIIELGNVWFFVQLIFGPHWDKNPNIA